MCRWKSLVLRHCWLSGRKGIRLVKNTHWWGAGVVLCLEQGADLHTAPLMPLSLTVSCFSKMQIGFTFLLLAHRGSCGQRAMKRVCVCVYVLCADVEMMLALILLTLLLPETPFSISSSKNRCRKRSVWKPSVLETMQYFVDFQEVCVVCFFSWAYPLFTL